ncbi:non-ribosomal peptide synthetase [Cellulosilyticum ruminicola]|uniref:non-ribosomal peptide synthetase n=1 Tax=Cellulosilyticum ruminicola TaxID=425254 RepID=UPI0006D14155|nr:non-ribosomal peptide synthetase [Cellulosilyticum ruminicola]
MKIRGYRIELGEIEGQINHLEWVKEAAVCNIQNNMGEAELVAYIVSNKSHNTAEIKEALRSSLPEYMLPTYYIFLEALPLTVNGKVDRKALPKPNVNTVNRKPYTAPANQLEEQLLEIWQQVLGFSEIGTSDEFFEIGGHSLKATLLLSKIQETFNVNLRLIDFFKVTTIKGQAELIMKCQKEDETLEITPAINAQGLYPVSFVQRRMFMLQQMNLENTSYNMPSAYLIKQELDVERFKKAIKDLMLHHEILRTTFAMNDGNLMQQVHTEETYDLPIEIEDVSVLYNKQQLNYKAYMKDFIKPFDLINGPIMRIKLVKIQQDKWFLIWDKHHIISDGISEGIFIKQLMSLYEGIALQAHEIQYRDFAVWHNKLFESGYMLEQKAYWLEQFKGELPVLNLPTDYPRQTMKSFAGASIDFSIDEILTKHLSELTYHTKTTLYMLLMAAYNVLLYKYTSQNDIIVGIPSAGRSRTSLQDVMGMFVSTLPIRNYIDGKLPFGEFLASVKENSLNAIEHQDYPFEMLVEDLNVQRDLSRNALFDVMFVMQNTDGANIESQIDIEPVNVENDVAKFDLTLIAEEIEGKISFKLEYSTKLFKEESMYKLVQHYIKLLEQISCNLECPIDQLELMTDREKQEILTKLNNTSMPYDTHQTITQLFENQVDESSSQVAVSLYDKQLTYKELNEKANSVAQYLREIGVVKDTVVGVMMQRSCEMMIGVLAILKAGGVYLPIDPTYPSERINYMLADSQTQILLIDKVYAHELDFKGVKINLDHVDTKRVENLPCINTPEDLAYIIYTSGSTGKPKGVKVRHKGIANLQAVFKNTLHIRREDCILQFASNSFDASIWEIFMALHLGATLCIVPKEVIGNSRQFETYLTQHHVTVATLPPTYLAQLQVENLPTLRMLITAGSATNMELVSKWQQNVTYINAYGPTESTICATMWRAKERLDKKLPIGQPIANTKVYIVDKNNQLLPIGVHGEICISGVGLAQGYVNKEELTASQFIQAPWCKEELLYKTGDLGQWLPDGNIEFLGRIDHQVKIRGYRIELQEIENQLLKYEGIQCGIVVEKILAHDEHVICAYYEAQESIEINELRTYLGRFLPEYMIPTYFVQVEDLPMTTNGKIDVKVLPDPRNAISVNSICIMPSNEIEEELMRIWKEILGIKEPISVEAHFFEIGGYSLKATQLLLRIKEVFKVEIAFADLFRYTTIREMGQLIDKQKYRVSQHAKQLILLRQGEDHSQALFVIHDGSGTIEGYLSLCKALQGNYPIWGICARDLKGVGPEEMTVKDLAQHYISLIKTVQPQGTYHIVGWSAGGNIAFEIVRQLEEDAVLIGYCAMFDAPAPSQYKKEMNALKDEKLFIKSLIDDSEFNKSLSGVTEIEEAWQVALKYLNKKYLIKEALVALKQRLPENLMMLLKEDSDMSIETFIRQLNGIRTIAYAVLSYKPLNTVKTEFTYFKAKENGANFHKHWQKYLEQDIICHEIDGSHMTILNEENAKEIGRYMNQYIK